MREIQKIRIAVSALGVSIMSLASANVVAASSTSLQALSAQQLAQYIAASGATVTC